MAWTIKRRLLALGGVGLVAMTAIGGVAAAQLNSTASRADTALTVANIRADVIDAQHTVAVVYADTNILYRVTGAQDRQDTLAEMDDHAAELAEVRTGLQDAHVDAQVDQELTGTFLPIIDKVLDLARSAHAAGGVVTDRDVQTVQQTWDSFDHASDGMGGDLDSAAERAERSAHTAARDGRLQILAIALLAILVAGVTVGLTGRAITVPVRRTRELLLRVAEGDFTGRLLVRTRDDLGDMAEALNATVDRVGASLLTMAREADSLASASAHLEEVSRAVTAGAERTGAAATEAARRAAEINDSVQAVASGSDQMYDSISQAAQQASRVSSIVAEAVTSARQANQTIGQLGQSSTKIGEVAKVISAIAGQTNLLALNATIEAARAGESGKGFAVVAGEVKDLAKETAQATGDIDERIAAIQADSVEAAQALEQISATIGEVSEVQERIAAAMSAQADATADMRHNMTRAAEGTDAITGRISAVEDSSHAAVQTAQETWSAAEQLAASALNLRRVAEGFRLQPQP